MFGDINIGTVALAILVVLILILIVSNIQSSSNPKPMWWSGWAHSTPCGAWACT